VVSQQRSVQRRSLSLAFPIRSQRDLQSYTNISTCLSIKSCDSIFFTAWLAGHYLPHCRRNSGTCMIVGVSVLGGWFGGSEVDLQRGQRDCKQDKTPLKSRKVSQKFKRVRPVGDD
jgi:hypothetical protein